jgi:putative selenate reductase molybdopterin-binding subunit
MTINLFINGVDHDIDCLPSETLLGVLRRNGFFGAKFGDEDGLTGSDTVLLDGRPTNGGSLLANQAQGHSIVTIESMGEYPDQGWRPSDGLHPLQRAFADNGAIQCGYCTPAQILAAKSLLDRNPNPTEQEIREAISGVLCRCTGYLKPVQAILHAAARIRGDESPDSEPVEWGPQDWSSQSRTESPAAGVPAEAPRQVLTEPKMVLAPQARTWAVVGKPERKVDAVKLVQGKPAFTADMEKRGTLIAKVLHSPHAHARIKERPATSRVVNSRAIGSDPRPTRHILAGLEGPLRGRQSRIRRS